jgi:hypothetical protein
VESTLGGYKVSIQKVCVPAREGLRQEIGGMFEPELLGSSGIITFPELSESLYSLKSVSTRIWLDQFQDYRKPPEKTAAAKADFFSSFTAGLKPAPPP